MVNQLIDTACELADGLRDIKWSVALDVLVDTIEVRLGLVRSSNLHYSGKPHWARMALFSVTRLASLSASPRSIA